MLTKFKQPLMAMMLFGAAAALTQFVAPSDVIIETTVSDELQKSGSDIYGSWNAAHVSQWSHYHQCTPSPCKKRKFRHKKGTGSVTE